MVLGDDVIVLHAVVSEYDLLQLFVLFDVKRNLQIAWWVRPFQINCLMVVFGPVHPTQVAGVCSIDMFCIWR